MADQSLLHSPIKPHFFKPLLQGFRTHLVLCSTLFSYISEHVIAKHSSFVQILFACLLQNIPVAFFSKHVEGKNDQNKIAKLRSDASEKTWLVKMDGLNLTDGWEDFAFAHDLRIGDIVIFRHEGEMVFHVTALGPSCCEIQYYTSSHNINDDDRNDQTNIGKLLLYEMFLNSLDNKKN